MGMCNLHILHHFELKKETSFVMSYKWDFGLTVMIKTEDICSVSIEVAATPVVNYINNQ